jgi:predicted peroxiredoxin
VKRLLLLCERGGYAPLHQAVSAGAAAVAQGMRVDLVLFHGALARVLDGQIDAIGDDLPHAAEARAGQESGRTAQVGEMLESARASGLRLFACSASVALQGREPADVAMEVDEVVGWPTILNWMSAADRVLYL